MQIQINVFLNPFVYCLFILLPNAFVKIAFILNIFFLIILLYLSTFLIVVNVNTLICICQFAK